MSDKKLSNFEFGRAIGNIEGAKVIIEYVFEKSKSSTHEELCAHIQWALDRTLSSHKEAESILFGASGIDRSSMN